MRLEIVTVKSTTPHRFQPLENYSVTGDNGYTYIGYTDLSFVKPGDRFAVAYYKSNTAAKFKVIHDPVQNKSPEEDLALALKAYFAKYDHEVCFGQELYEICTSDVDETLVDMMLQEPYLSMILENLSTGEYGVNVIPIDDEDDDE